MRGISTFAGGLGAGAFLTSLLAAIALLWRPDVVGGWLEPSQRRTRQSLERAERLARHSPDYLDVCRAAGL